LEALSEVLVRGVRFADDDGEGHGKREVKVEDDGIGKTVDVKVEK
jgi:hypothetical protein